MHDDVTLIDRLKYAFDNTLSRGPLGLVAWLAAASAVVVIVVSLVVSLARLDPGGRSFPALVWMSLMRTLDPGTMGGDEGSWPFLLTMLAVTLGGIFVISSLIGVITSGIESRLDELRRGRSRVIERDHTAILGWSGQGAALVAELAEANANQPGGCVVVLAPYDRVELEAEIRDKVGSTRGTRVVCRTGSPMDIADLDLVRLTTSKVIVVLSPEGDDPDAAVVKTLLAITNDPGRREAPYHIVAEIRDPRNVEAARLAGHGEAELVSAGDTIARMIAQTCRQSGLSVVYQDLLDFSGDEIYFHAEPALAGRTFAEALPAFASSTVIGLAGADGRVRLAPAMDTVLGPDDELIVIAADDDTTRLAHEVGAVDEAALTSGTPAEPAPERTLVLGWNWRAPAVINELDHYVAPGSEVVVVAADDRCRAAVARECEGLANLAVDCRVGDTTDRRTLDALDAGQYDHIIVLCDSDTHAPEGADARTLITLLHLRDIGERAGSALSIVSEMLNPRNRELAQITRADDFIVSGRIVSLLVAQVAENRRLNAVFADIFDPEGVEIYLKPAGDYVRLDTPVSFFTVLESARRRGEVAIGYRRIAHAEDAAAGFGVRLNPDKGAAVTFGPGDKVIVLAED